MYSIILILSCVISTYISLRQPGAARVLDHSQGKGNKTDVIICTQCGKKNADEARFCEKCDKKLQSSRQSVELTDSSNYWVESFKHEGISPFSKQSLWKMVEAWGYIALLIGVAAGCFFYKVWWPLYPTVGLLGLVAWLRRL